MDNAVILHVDPTRLAVLDRPVLVVMLTGWIDASGAAAAAMAALEEAVRPTPVATFDGDVFVDYRARRPTMELREGVNTRLAWSDIELVMGTSEAGHVVYLLRGPEPDMQWRRFAHAVADLAQTLGVYQMVGFGAYPFASPHTRPCRLSVTSPSADVVASVPYLKSTLDAPAGATALLEHALTERGIPSLGLWVQVPHYVSAMPYPAAAQALLDGLADNTGIRVSTPALSSEAAAQHDRIERLVSGNPEHEAMVAKLEEAHDLLTQTGDDIAAELERFLRDQ